MENDFLSVSAALRAILTPYKPELNATTDTPERLYLVSKLPSPFKQHKGGPMFFGSVQTGKAYVSFHLFPLYMNEALTGSISPALKKRMQGKTCFNFKSTPEPALIEELAKLTEAGFKIFREKNWV
jgi:hypothetical protein